MMKKIITAVCAVIGAILILAAGLFIYFAVEVSDKTDNTPEEILENDYTFAEVLNRELTDALSEEEDICVDLSTQDLNEMLYAALKDIKISGLNIKGAYVKYENEAYTAEIPVKAYGVSSCLKLSLTLSVGKEEGVDLHITDVRMGKLKADSFIVKKLVLSKGTRKKIMSSLEKKGILLTISDDLEITMNRTQILDTVKGVVPQDSNRDLIYLLAKLALSEDFFSITTNTGSVTATIKTDGLLYDEERDGNITTLLDYTNPVTKTTAALSSLTLEQVPVVFAYYTQGYSALSDENKKIVDDLGYSKSEEGIKDKGKTILSILADSSKNFELKEFLINHAFTIAVTENQFNSVFASMDFIGAGTAFTDGTRIAYISMESLYFDIKDEALTCTIILNMNGKRLCIKADAECLNSDSLCLEAKVEELYIGGLKLSSDYIPDVMTYLGGIMKSQSWISVTEDTIILNLEESLNQALGLDSDSEVKQHVSSGIQVKEDLLEILLKYSIL